jgi:hypothetical protein
MKHSFYSVNDFPDYSGTLWETESMVDTQYIVIYCYGWYLNNIS